MTKERPPRDADATRKRLIAAATAEFAQYGIAGARVDRIAEEAQTNKAQIYHYFGNKENLFNMVFQQVVDSVAREAPLDPHDLGDYAGRLFDGYEQRPDIARLATWYRLERGESGSRIDAIVQSNDAKLEAIAKAQADGTVASTFDPTTLLGLILHLAALWTAQTPEYEDLANSMTRSQRREAVVAAVRALV